MTQLEKIRAMSAEKLAAWLIDVEMTADFSSSFACLEKFCPLDSEGECSEAKCLAAAVRYLESEVEEK